MKTTSAINKYETGNYEKLNNCYELRIINTQGILKFWKTTNKQIIGISGHFLVDNDVDKESKILEINCNSFRKEYLTCQKIQSSLTVIFFVCFILGQHLTAFRENNYFNDYFDLINKDNEFSNNCFFCNETQIYINRLFICENQFFCLYYANEETINYCEIKRRIKFKCKFTNETIQFFQVCNYITDCSDGSDEEYCGKIKIRINF